MLKFHYPGSWENCTYSGLYYIKTYPTPADKNTLVSTRSADSCREFFVRNYRFAINKKYTNSPDIRKAYVLFTLGKPRAQSQSLAWQQDLASMAEKSVYIMNSFEKAHKWPLTKVYSVDTGEQEIPFVFFSGCRKWTMSPYLMSIWALCVRLGKNNWLPKNLMTLDHENLVRQIAICAASGNNTDSTQLSKTIRHWDNLMLLYPDLFGNNTRKYNWSLDRLNGGADRPEGVLKLVIGSTYNKTLRKRYCELIKERGLK